MSVTFAPYAARVRCEAAKPIEDKAAQALVAGLLEEVGRQCQQGGARLIGHIKCLAEFAGGYLRGNLTDFGRPADVAGEVPAPIQQMDVLLHVLVYGLTEEDVDECVHAALRRLEQTGGTRWEHIWLKHENHPHAPS
ncbi:MAG: hypothetical protein ACP5TV_00575 [Anaerolineae bacterium]